MAGRDAGERVAEKWREADLLFHRVGITFAVYGDDAGAERLIPFDTIPRVISKLEWDVLAKGLRQRVAALNRFLHDIYHGQEILKEGLVPAEQVLTNDAYQVAMLGLELPNHVYCHVAGNLPNLAEKLLGEALLMPSVATWWCGEPAALEEVIANIDHLVIARS